MTWYSGKIPLNGSQSRMNPRSPWLTFRLFPQTSQLGLWIIELICSWPPTPRCRIICTRPRSRINKTIFLNATVISCNLVSEDYYVQKRGSVCTEGGGARVEPLRLIQSSSLSGRNISLIRQHRAPGCPGVSRCPWSFFSLLKKGGICRTVQSVWCLYSPAVPRGAPQRHISEPLAT